MNRFVRPDEVTIPLTHGDTITIRRELTHGETIAGYRQAYLKQPDGTYVRDPLATGMALVTVVPDRLDVQGRRRPRRADQRPQSAGTDRHAERDRQRGVHRNSRSHPGARGAAGAGEATPGSVTAIRSDLNIARRCGWRYDWVRDLDEHVHRILVEMLLAEDEAARVRAEE